MPQASQTNRKDRRIVPAATTPQSSLAGISGEQVAYPLKTARKIYPEGSTAHHISYVYGLETDASKRLVDRTGLGTRCRGSAGLPGVVSKAHLSPETFAKCGGCGDRKTLD